MQCGTVGSCLDVGLWFFKFIEFNKKPNILSSTPQRPTRMGAGCSSNGMAATNPGPGRMHGYDGPAAQQVRASPEAEVPRGSAGPDDDHFNDCGCFGDGG